MELTKVMLRVFVDMKVHITVDSLEKSANVESVSYSQLLKENSPYLLNDSRINDLSWCYVI